MSDDIVVGLDGSAATRAALHWAAKQARGMGGASSPARATGSQESAS